MKILIISLAGIGDTFLATPLIRVLREQLPNAEIELLVRWTGARDLVGGNPRVNRIHQKELVKEGAVGSLKFLRVLRRERYDVSINTHPQGKVQYRMIARLIGARLRLSHRYENYSLLDRLLVNRTIDQDYGIHCIENNFRLLPLMGLREPKEPVGCELFFSSEEEQWAQEFIGSRKLSSSIRLGIHVGSGTTKNLMFKRWPVENYIALIKQVLAAYPNVAALLFGGPEEKQENQRILAAVNDARSLEVPSRTLKEAAALLQQCDIFLSVDNLFMHLAAAVKVPRQIVIESPTFNKTIEPYHRPFHLVPNPMVAGKNLEYYRYDGRDIQGGAEHLLACMRSITPEAAVAKVVEALNSVNR